jgi:(p)ppGpp synthase/HD superfamily hydrolase
MKKNIVDIASRMAAKYMHGKRHGSGRYAWEHPGDVVKYLQRLGVGDAQILATAWLHDVLEDGTLEGYPVDYSSILDELIRDYGEEDLPTRVMNDVMCLSHQTNEPKSAYLSNLATVSEDARLVKCADRICNLREGVDTFKRDRWIRYIGETYYFIYPLTKGLEHQEVLQKDLLAAAGARNLA